MRYRNQYISTLLSNENFEVPISMQSNISDIELDKFMENLDLNINNIYEKLIVNLDDLSKKIDRNYNENNKSISSIEERILKLEEKNLNIDIIDDSDIVKIQSKEKFENNLKKINLDIDSFLENEIELSKNIKEDHDFYKNNNRLSYNKNWEEEFNKRGLSLENDGIYEYEDGEEDMKYEYYNGELPKTKIVKVRAVDGIQTYTKDDISSFIENESKKLALNEVSKLHSQSETTQKAWLANNQRLVELTNIIESQEKEIRRLSQNSMNKDNLTNDDVSNLISNKAIKILKEEYDARLSALENKNGILNENKDIKKILDDLKFEQEENKKLRSMLNNSQSIPNQKVELVVSTSPMQKSVVEKNNLDLGRKRKQKHFFEIIEHKTPKITKADLDK